MSIFLRSNFAVYCYSHCCHCIFPLNIGNIETFYPVRMTFQFQFLFQISQSFLNYLFLPEVLFHFLFQIQISHFKKFITSAMNFRKVHLYFLIFLYLRPFHYQTAFFFISHVTYYIFWYAPFFII